MEEDPRTTLVQFLRKDVKDFMDFALDIFESFAPPFMVTLYPGLDRAWSELRTSLPLAAEEIQRLEVSILAQHGLAGGQLQLKIETTRRGFDRVREKVSRIRRKGPSYVKKRRWYLARLIKWAAKGFDNLLDSLASLVPLVGAISELKGVIEWTADGVKLRI